MDPALRDVFFAALFLGGFGSLILGFGSLISGIFIAGSRNTGTKRIHNSPATRDRCIRAAIRRAASANSDSSASYARM